MAWTIDNLFDLLVEQRGSDLAFVPGSPPVIWTAGRMRQVVAPPLTDQQIGELFLPALSRGQAQRLSEIGDVDFSVGKPQVGRLRINMHRQSGTYSAAVRFVPSRPPVFDELNLPPRVLSFADLPHGLVLVTGTAGSGKSSTLAAMIDYMNRRYAYHIITLEDPVEFTFPPGTSIIEQREIGVDCPSFASALRHVVRQRPDVILVGEMRDLETISAALTAAETGHLVIATLHTINAVQSVERVVDVFPAGQQAQVRVQLAGALQGIVCQTLFHDEAGGGLVPAVEIMLATPGVQRAIRDRETHLLAGMIETGRSQGMQAMDAAIAALVRDGRISPQAAMAKAHNPDKLARLLAA